MFALTLSLALPARPPLPPSTALTTKSGIPLTGKTGTILTRKV